MRLRTLRRSNFFAKNHFFGKRTQRPQAKALFEPLEQRVLLSADLTFEAGVAADLILQLDSEDSSILQIFDNTDQTVVAEQALAETNRVVIQGSSETDRLTIDTNRPFEVSGGIEFIDSFEGDDDVLQFSSNSDITASDAPPPATPDDASTADSESAETDAAIPTEEPPSVAPEDTSAADNESTDSESTDTDATITNWIISGLDTGSVTTSTTLTYSGIENLSGGTANDIFNFQEEGSVSGIVDGGDGANSLDYSTRITDVTVNLESGEATDTDGGIFNIQNVSGGAGNDTLTGDDSANTLSGGAGDDTLSGGAGDDTLYGDEGDDTLYYSEGSDTYDGGTGTDTLASDNADGTWNIQGDNSGTLNESSFSNIENLLSGTGIDTFSFAENAAIGGTIDGGAGQNSLDYSGVTSNVSANLSTGQATATAGISNIQNVIGGSGNDLLIGDNLVNILFGGGGHDTISGRGGNDNLQGGEGIDTLTETADSNFTLTDFTLNSTLLGEDVLLDFEEVDLTGGSSDNVFDLSSYGGTARVSGDAGNDTFKAGSGTVSIDGGAGVDTLQGEETDNQWDVLGVNLGTLNDYSFDNIENLVGGALADNFVLAAGALVGGFIDGRSGRDTLNYALYGGGVTIDLTSGTATGATGGVLDIEVLLGSAAGDTLLGALAGGYLDAAEGTDTLDFSNVSSDLTITLHDNATISATDGTNTVNNIAGIENIVGSSGTNTYVFEEGASLNGEISGTGPSILDYSAYTTEVDVDLAGGTATGTNGVANVSAVIGGAGDDTLYGPSADATWNITGDDSGGVAGIDFSEIENLNGAANNEDTFVFSPDGSLSGLVEGGDGGFDSMVIDGGSYTTVTSIATGPDSGTIDLDGKVITYAGLEPVVDSSTTANRTYSIATTPAGATTNDDTIILQDTGGAGDGSMLLDSGIPDTFEEITFTVPSTSLTLNSQGGVDTISVTSFDSTFDANLTINTGDGADIILLDTTEGTGTFTIDGGSGDDEITIGDLSSSTATAVSISGGADNDTYFFGNDWGTITISDTSGVDTLDFSGYAGTLTISSDGLTITGNNAGTISTITVTGTAIENIENGDVVLATAKTVFLNGLQSLVDWADALANYGDMAAKLPIVAANVGVGVGTALDIADALEQLRLRIDNYFLTHDFTTENLLAAVGGAGGFTESGITHAGGTIEGLGDLTIEVQSGVTLDVIVGLVPELRLTLDLEADRTTGFGIDIGGEDTDASDLGLNFDVTGTIDMASHLDAELVLGLKLGTSPSFFLDVIDLGVTGEISTTNFGIGLDIGFLGAAIESGDITMNAGLNVNFSDPMGLTVADLNPGSIGSLISLSETSNALSVFDLPIKITAGLSGLDAAIEAKILLDGAEPVPDLFSGAPLEVKLEDFDLGDTFSIDNLKNFKNTSVSGILSLIRQLGNTLDDIGGSELFSSYDIPFIDTDLSDALDFADMITDALIYDDGDDGHHAAADKLLDVNGAPTFHNAQDFASKLAEILSIDLTAINAIYNPTAETLKFHIDLSDTFVDVKFPVDYNLDLSPLLDIDSDLELTLQAGGSLTLDMGLYLGAVSATGALETITNSTPLTGTNSLGIDIKTDPAVTGEANVSSIDGQLTGDAHFTITNGGTDYDITILASATSNNTTATDLKNDITDALALTAISGVTVSVPTDENRIVMTSASSGFKVTALSSDPATREIGFGTDQDAVEDGASYTIKTGKDVPSLVGRFGSEVTFNITIGTTTTTVTLDQADTDGNKNIVDLVNDVNNAISDTTLDGVITASSIGKRLILTAVDATSGFSFDVSAVADLGFSSIASSNDFDFVIKLSDGTTHRIALDHTDTTISDVITAINNSTNDAAVGAGHVTAAVDPTTGTYIKLTDNTFVAPGPNLFRVEAINGSSAAMQLGLLRIDALEEGDRDGIIESNALAGSNPADRFFIENALIKGDFEFLGAVDASATFGFVGISLDGTAKLHGEISAGLKDLSGTLGGRLTLNEIINKLNNIGDVDKTDKITDIVALPTITNLIDHDSNEGTPKVLGNVSFTVDLEPDIADIFIGSLPTFNITINDIGNPFTENEFIGSGLVFVDTDSFTVAGNQTTIFTAGLHIIAESSPALNAQVLSSSYDSDADKTTVLLVSDVLEGTLSKITAPTPTLPDIVLPDFDTILGDLAKFDDIDFDDILTGIQQLLTFLQSFEAFDFLKDPIPLINKSVHDLMGFADGFSDAIADLQNNPAGSLQLLEAKLLDALGLSPVTSLFDTVVDGLTRVSDTTFTIASDVTDKFVAGFQVKIGNAVSSVVSSSVSAGVTTITLVDSIVPTSFSEVDLFVSKFLGFDLVDGLSRLTDNTFELAGDLRSTLALGSKIDFGSEKFSSIKNIVYDAASGKTTITLFDDILTVANSLFTLADLDITPDFIDFAIDSVGDIDVLRIDLMLVEGFNESLNVQIPDFLDIPALGGLLDLSGSADLGTSGSIIANLDFGIALDTAHLGDLYIFDTTGLAANVTAGGDNLAFRAALGPLSVNIIDGSASIGADFSIDFNEGATTTDGAVLLTTVISNLSTYFDVELGGSIDVELPTYFPRESNFIGDITLDISDISDYFDDLSAIIDEFDYEDVVTKITEFDFSKFNIFDGILLAVDGVDLFLEGLQDVMDGDLFGFEIPFIGDALSGGVDFITDLRDDFIAPLQALIEKAPDLAKDFVNPDKNIISDFLFDILGSSANGATGAALDLLIQENGSGDPLLSGDNFVSLLGPGGIQLGGHTALDDYLFNPDSTVQRDDIYIEWDMHLGDSYTIGGSNTFDLGIPGLGIEFDGEIDITVTWDLDFGFGISFADGPYLIIDDLDELMFTVDVDLADGTTLTGKLGFLQLGAAVVANEFNASFAVNIKNKNDTSEVTDRELAFTELGDIDLVMTLGANAYIDLDLTLELNKDLVGSSVSSGFPSITSGFVFDWGFDPTSITDPGFGNSIAEGLKLVEFQDVSLDLGSYVNEVLNPILSTIQDITDPIQPLIDVFTTPFPVLSDFGIDLTLLDLAAAYGQVDPSMIYAIADIITFINDIDLGGGGADFLEISFGDFTIFDDGTSTYSTSGSTLEFDLWDANLDLGSTSVDSVFSQLEGAIQDVFGDNWFSGTVDSLAGEAADIMGDALDAGSDSEGGFAFPIIEDPSQVFGLLMGRPAVLVTYDMAPLEFEFDWSQFFSIWGPLGVSINAEFGVTIDFAFGYDTLGIQQFVESDFRDFAAMLNGFYISDTDLATGDFGKDVPEVVVEGGIWAAAECNLAVARFGVGGGVFFEVEFDLNDPDKDGRVRINEIVGNVANQLMAPDIEDKFLAPIAMFDVSGRLFAELFAFLKVDLFLFEIDKRWELTPEIEILSFDIDFYRPPKLATVQNLESSNILQLNIGDFADRRLNGDLTDGDETITVTGTASNLQVSGFGYTLDYEPESGKSFTKILAIGGEGNDVIDLSGVTDSSIIFEIEGGVGNDILKAGAGDALIRGGSGDDEIWGGAGNDVIYGEKGLDEIHGGAGDDLLFGDDGNVGDESVQVMVAVSDGDDTLYGDGGNDILFGGGGHDTIDGGAQDDLIIGDGGEIVFTSDSVPKTKANVDPLRGANPGITKIERGGSGGNDTLLGGLGVDFIFGGLGDDKIEGGSGEDEIFGGSGFDTIDGGSEGDLIFGDSWRVVEDIFNPGVYLLRPTGDGSADTIYGGTGGDTIYGDGGADYIEGGGNSGIDKIYGGSGADILYGDSVDSTTPYGEDWIYGEGGPDTLYGGGGDDRLDGGAGDDVLFGDYGSEDFKTPLASPGDYSDVNIYGSNIPTGYALGATKSLSFDPDNDPLTPNNIWIGADTLYGGIGSDFMDGQGNYDTYIIKLQGADRDSRINVSDSGDSLAETDLMRVFGTVYDDEFLLRASVSSSGLAFVGLINDDTNIERINYWDTERMVIEGSLGDDYFAIDDVRAETTIEGGIGEDLFQVGQMYRSQRNIDPDYANVAEDDIFATIETTRGWLSNGISRPMTINGGVGNDNFIVFHNKAVLTLNGEDGDDTFLIKAFALAGSQEPIRERTDISGGSGADLVQYAMNAPVNIDGGDGFDTVIVIGTEFGDDFVITKDGVYGAGLNVNFVNIESLQVDGAEGDDRFYVQSTSEKFITEIAGGLGSDTFNMSGDMPPIISNDLRGHSGIITHEIDTFDPLYTGIKIDGISANVADDDVGNVVILTEGQASMVIAEGGADGSYTVLLSEQPTGDVYVQAYAPVQSSTSAELGQQAFYLFSSAPGVTIAPDGTSLTLKFTTSNWYIAQTVAVIAFDDSALEGTRNGVVNHVVMNPTTISDVEASYTEITFDDETKGTLLTDSVHASGKNFDQYDFDLAGMMVLITDGPGAGQSLRIKEYTADTLTLYGEFSEDWMPVNSSQYLITKDIEAVRSINVEIYDNDAAGVLITQSDSVTDIHEGGVTDTIDMVLTREVTDTDKVTVTLNNLNGQLSFSQDVLTFTSGDWSTAQTVTVTALDDTVREGFHHGLITFAITSTGDTDQYPATSDSITLADDGAYVGLSHKPVDSETVTVTKTIGTTTTTIADIEDVTSPTPGETYYKIISNKVIFVDDEGGVAFLLKNTQVDVSYSYLDPGYNLLENKRGFEVKPIQTNIADNDVAQVWIRESKGSTDVIEGSSLLAPWTDTYEVLLTRQPTENVEIIIDPQVTKTSSGKNINWGEQVEVTFDISTAPGAVANGDGTITLLFTSANWDTPQIVSVRAIDDSIGDGDDTQVFAPMLHTVGEIQGPLFIYGASGKGSLINIDPLMLSHELNIKPETGEDISVAEDGFEITVAKAAIDQLIYEETGNSTPYDYLKYLVEGKRTLEVTEGPALDQFRLIVDVEESGTDLILSMNKAFDLETVAFDGSSDTTVFTGSSDTLTIGSHNFVSGQSVTYSNGGESGDSDIGGLTDGAVYYVIVINSTSVQLAASKANAIAETAIAIDLTALGTGTNHQLNERYADISKYAITSESPNFWAIEEEQIDYLFLNNTDSPADNVIASRAGMLTDATTIGFTGNSILEEFVTKMDGKRITGLGMGEDLYIGSTLQPGGITYGDLEVVEINLGRGIDHFTVEDTHSRSNGFQTWTILNGGDEPVPGDGDTITVRTLGSEATEVASGTVNSITGSLTFTDSEAHFSTAGIGLTGYLIEITDGTGFGQTGIIDFNTATDITVSQGWATSLDDTSQYRITSTVLLSGDTESALVNKGTTLEGSSFTQDLVGRIIEITDGPGSGLRKEIVAVTDSTHLTVSSAWDISDKNAPAVSGYRIYGEVDGPIAINTQGGDDRVEVEEATTSIPLVIFGGFGNDELEGGSADDIIFGDEGRVDYVDEDGKIVTLLGLAREIIDPRQIVTAGNNTSDPDSENHFSWLTDPGAAFPTADDGLKGMIISITDGPDYRYLGQNRIITGNTADTLYLNKPWDTDRIPDSDYKYRISLIPEDQTDAVVRDPSRILSIDHTQGGMDTITGNNGNDILIGGANADIINGNVGDDTIFGDNGQLDYNHVRTDIPARGDLAPTALDLIQTTHHETGGIDTLSGNEGSDIIVGGQAGDLLYGDDATGSAATADSGDIIMGDNGEVIYLQGVMTQIRTTDDLETTGGADTIMGNYGDDIILGGVNGSPDVIEGNDGDDLILGDNGLLDFAYDGDTDLSTLDFVSSEPYASDGTTVLGGADIISGNGGNDTVIAGTGGDTVYGDNAAASAAEADGEDILIGDNADIILAGDVPGQRLVMGSAVHTITTTDNEEATGGDDTISGNAADDIILGGVGGDTIYGDAVTEGIHDAAPSPKVNDINDIILGDNGVVDFNTGDDDYTTLDLVETADVELGGVDTIYGNDGDDYILGGKDGDIIYGNADDDIVLGDFGRIILVNGIAMQVETMARTKGGSDTIYGNQDEDILIGGAYGDNIDGDEADDLIFGDNVLLDRLTGLDDFTNPRFRTLTGTTIYGEEVDVNDGDPLVDGIDRNIPDLTGTPEWGDWDITLLDHTAADEAAGLTNFGDDYIAGGGDDDTIFAQLGDDIVQGDGSIDGKIDDGLPVNAYRDSGNLLQVVPSFEAETDGDDYIEGNGGSDVIFGNLGQDDIIGDNSNLFSLTDYEQRLPHGSDLIFGGAGTDIDRNNLGDLNTTGHARDADMILGDNGNIYRLVSVVGGAGETEYLEFSYDQNSQYEDRGDLRIIPRAAELLDYTPGGLDYYPTAGQAASDIGMADEIHGESGDDFIYGMKGADILFGEGQDDDLIGGYGLDWISGGTGQDGVLGDDGRIYTSRNDTEYETLYNIDGIDGKDLDEFISTPGKIQQATIHVEGTLKKTVNLTPFRLGDTAIWDPLFDPADADDIIYGGWGSDFLHGGSGDDAISGAEALGEFYGAPINSGNVLNFEGNKAGEFADYDEYNPRQLIAGFLLNFDSSEGPLDDRFDGYSTASDGDDVIFGDLGNDWLVGGSGKDHIYGGYGNDLLNADDDHGTNSGANDAPDTDATYEDIAYGGAGRDVLIGNTGGDRLIDWVGEFNSYVVPYAPFGAFSVSRTLQPQLQDYLYDLSAADGADSTRAADTGADQLRNGEPEGELGLVLQKDFDWKDQTGAPDDPQAGNIPGGKRDVLRSATFNSGSLAAEAFAADSGVWNVEGGALQVSADSVRGDAVSVYHINQYLPGYYEVQATVEAIKPTAGWKANSYIIFDYVNEYDFKFAGINASTDKIEMGHRSVDDWIVDEQTPSKIRPGTSYNLLLAINGTTATLVVDGSDVFSHAFDPRVDESGWTYGLNDGMIGFGSNNSRGSFDNISVLKLAPEYTMEATETFDDSLDNGVFTGSVTGEWNLDDGRYTATGEAMSLVDLDQPIAANSIVQLESTFSIDGMGGIVFDCYSKEDFKFAALDTENGQLVVGHHTDKGGWSIDSVVDSKIKAETDYTMTVTLQGSTVGVSLLDGDHEIAASGYAYNALVVDGATGLMSTGGTSSFDTSTVRTDDPAFQSNEIAETSQSLMAAEPVQVDDDVTFVTYKALEPIVEAAIDRWEALLNLDDGDLDGLFDDVTFQITDLGGTILGETEDMTIRLDDDAAGYGWFIDPSPEEDSEFIRKSSSGDYLAKPTSDAYGDMDLLSTVMHEMGHILGEAHTDAGLMNETLADGIRTTIVDSSERQSKRETIHHNNFMKFNEDSGEFEKMGQYKAMLQTAHPGINRHEISAMDSDGEEDSDWIIEI